MQLTESIRKKVIIWYCVLFLFAFLYRYFNNALLSQVVPSFFYNKIDFTSWIVQASGLHRSFLNDFYLCLLADFVYCFLPFAYLFLYLKKGKFIRLAGGLLFIYNLIYSVVYCCFPTDSIVIHIAFMVFPLVFIPLSLQGFWFMLNGLRYFFLFFFASAGIWKIVQGGLFSFQEMSGILLYQHKELLVTDASSLLLSGYRWLIAHPFVSYWLYFFAAIIELSFSVGFFTKKCDRILVVLYLTFLVMDSILMRIDYWETLPFVLCLLFSKYDFEECTQLSMYNDDFEPKSLQKFEV